ncbi:class I SAM-dependent methyltransferase [Paenibacillus kobensis]|uniref:class I SAM-dependent methyltransferase n=1 Tax=Paenibacillus kobensis TaxID=59841 RepID=UPI000FD97150|nr:class I SAM-dependent methyltransferase [Paenibacillus kobensis]
MSEKRQEVYEQVGVAATCRGYDEYVRMFTLNGSLEGKSILDIAGGAASFTADCRSRGIDARAVDPRYGLDTEAVLADARQEIETSTDKIRAIAHRFDFSYYGNVDLHREGRLRSFARFAEDFTSPDKEERYIAGSLPALPFADGSFDLVLCSHFLFLYADQFGPEFHEQAVLEMIRLCRPGGEVRIYPLKSLQWEPYPHMEALFASIRKAGAAPFLAKSELPFIPGSSEMLVIQL